jgi:hypothetical protein
MIKEETENSNDDILEKLLFKMAKGEKEAFEEFYKLESGCLNKSRARIAISNFSNVQNTFFLSSFQERPEESSSFQGLYSWLYSQGTD